MANSEFSLGAAFVLGMASFLSPCVLPVVPAYLSLISGLSFDELQAAESVRLARWRLFGSAVAFVLGFSIVVVAVMGSAAQMIGRMGEQWQTVFRWIGGTIVTVFALHMIGVFRIKALFAERRFHFSANRLGYLGALLIGAAFVVGWTPCIGPALSGVLAVAATSEASGWWLLVAYTLGLAVPFLLAAVFVDLFLGSMRKLTRYARVVEIVSGVLLLVMGVLLVTNGLRGVSAWAIQHLPDPSWRIEEKLK